MTDEHLLSGACRIFVVSRFASEANQRVVQLLRLEERGLETVLVYEPHGRPERQIAHGRTLRVRRLVHPVSVADRLAQWVGFRPPGARMVPAPAERSFNAAAVAAIAREIRTVPNRNTAVVLVTPPHHLALLTPDLKSLDPQVRVLIDWQDLWAFDENYAGSGEAQERISALETCSMRAADANVFTNSQAEAAMREQKSKVGDLGLLTSIAHAFDGDLLPWVPVRRPPAAPSEVPLRLGFLGNLFKPPKVPGREFMAELDRLAVLGVRFTFTVLGDKRLEEPDMLQRFARPWLKAEARLTHARAVEWMTHADWLVLLLADLPNCYVIFHMKLVSYLQLGKPILAVVPAGSFAASLVERYAAGVVVPPGPQLAERMEHALETWTPDETVRAQADRNELSVERFLDAWEELVVNAWSVPA